MMRAAVDSVESMLIMQADAPGFERLIGRLVAPPSTLDLDGIAIDDHSRPIRTLSFRVGDGLIAVHVDAERASITGSREALEFLAEDIRAFVEHNDLLEPGVHSHIEPRSTPSGERYLADSSASLFLVGLVPETT